MKAVTFFLAFLVLVSVVNSQSLNDYQSLETNVKVQGAVDVLKQSGSYQLDYISSELSFFPRNDRFQTIEDQTFSAPLAKTSRGDNIDYRWTEFSPELSFGVNSYVISQTNFNRVNKKIRFPIEADLSEFQEYLQPTELVNSDDARIINQAKRISEGEDDLYVVVYNLGKWTKENINYSLDTLTVEAAQDSIWVLENRKGVCDELTTLFVSMLRSLGVPARFALGSSYTNVIGQFGNHAWAEVYFPGVGWVAFDPTYGQLGYVDSTHIKMRESLDVKEPSINYLWRARNIDIKPKEIVVEVGVLEKGEVLKYNVDLDLELLKNNVGPGSYVPLKVKVRNNENYYLPITIYLTKGPATVEDNSLDLLLKPHEEATGFFHIEVPKDLNKDLVYESELEVEGYGGLRDSVKLEYGEHYTIYTKEEAVSRMSQSEREDGEGNNLEIFCSPGKEVYYTYEDKGLILCEVSNPEDVVFKDLKICFETDCKDLTILGNEQRKVEFEFYLKEKKREAVVTLESNEVSRSSYFDLNILADANVQIVNLEYPKTVDYRGEGEVKFTLVPNSKVNSVEVSVGNKRVFSKEELRFRNDFVVPFDGDFFFFREPYIEVIYKDVNNKEHIIREVVNIDIMNVPWYAKIMRMFSF